ncbi:competence type IV pilus minor pilin ComGG [Pseudalkalibacillus caeni]|nr:competence type IV pilus minor pilin ComGG [Pseudalkalibacillus caeni]
MNARNGFITPLTLSFALLLSCFLLAQLTIYESELMFFHEQQEIVIREALLFLGMNDTIANIQKGEVPDGEQWLFEYEVGSSVVAVHLLDENRYEATISCTTKKQIKGTAVFIYNKADKGIESWMEENR